MSRYLHLPSYQEAPPRWTALLHTWAREGGLRSPIGMFPPHHAPALNTIADQALPVVVPLVSRLDTRLHALHHEVMEVGGEARNTTVRVRRIDEEQDRHRETILTLQEGQMSTKAHVQSLEERIAALERRTEEAKARATTAEQLIDRVTHEMSEMAGHLVHIYGI
ncbi:hypothetical protein L1887_28758 [Cichorium endivia]|nr:hypothetical protein L1887_28758 [Cichorium endivia]